MTSTGQWHWHKAADAGGLEERPPRTAPQDAQAWCNFTLWHPGQLPVGCDSAVGTLRREAPPGRTGASAGRTPWSSANPAAYRTEISGGGRRLRLKQFLYDWAFPAADHPCLWGSKPRPFPIGGRRVVWLGTDYLGHPAAAARMSRTTVELSVLEGEFTDTELVELFRSLRPADPAADARVLATPFSELSYWARYPADTVEVPTGLFLFKRPEGPHEGDWVPPAGLEAFLRAQGLPAALGGFPADSAALYPGAGRATELEVLYTCPHSGAELRLMLQRPGRGRMQFPPRQDQHPSHTEQLDDAGRAVHLAYVDGDVGPFDAVWQEPDGTLQLRLLSSARQGIDRAFFLSCLTETTATTPLTGPEAAL